MSCACSCHQVQDLHSITPDYFLEVSGAVIHPLSYQQVGYIFSINFADLAHCKYVAPFFNISVILSSGVWTLPTYFNFCFGLGQKLPLPLWCCICCRPWVSFFLPENFHFLVLVRLICIHILVSRIYLCQSELLLEIVIAQELNSFSHTWLSLWYQLEDNFLIIFVL